MNKYLLFALIALLIAIVFSHFNKQKEEKQSQENFEELKRLLLPISVLASLEVNERIQPPLNIERNPIGFKLNNEKI